jgi:cytoskeletal protein CcmA (bactofilin family)
MFGKNEAVRPPQPITPAPAASVPPPPAATPAARPEVARQSERDLVNIGKSVVIKGELSGSEDLTIEGQIEGKIELRQHILTVGPNAKITAQILAKAVIVQGEVHGNITATDKIEIRDAGSVMGDLTAPRVAIADGAQFRGSIDMQRAGAADGSTGAAKGTVEGRPAASIPMANPGSPTAR